MTKDLSPKQKKELQAQINHSVLADTLREFYTKELDSLISLDESSKQYETPNWAYLQAHKNGRQSELKKLLKILTKENL